MFCNLETLNNTHKAFLEELVALMAQADAKFGPLFIKYVRRSNACFSVFDLLCRPTSLRYNTLIMSMTIMKLLLCYPSYVGRTKNLTSLWR